MSNNDYTAQDFIATTRSWRAFCVQCAEGYQKRYVEAKAAYQAVWNSPSFRERQAPMVEMDRAHGYVSVAIAGIALADAIIAAGEMRIGVWAASRAGASMIGADGKRANRSDDYAELLKFLGAYDANVPDNGSMLAGVSLLIDRTAGITYTNYCY